MIIIILIIIFLILSFLSYKKIDISRYNIENEKIDKDLKIIVLSDLHNRNIKKKLSNILSIEKPDIIILSGDMVNEDIKYTKHFIELCEVLDKYKTYYTFGNHEKEMSQEDINKYYKLLAKTKLTIINNKNINLSNNIKLYGFDADISFFRGLRKLKLTAKDINDKLGSINANNFNILVAHDPREAKCYSKYGFDLTISGHVHGGLIRIPFLGGLLSPNYTFFPKYFQGNNKVNNMNLIVSRGLGFCRKIPFRILNPGEVVIISIVKNK